jgi:hypothetical protein
VAAKTRCFALALAAIGAALLASCASGSEAPVSIYGNPPALEDYLEALRGDYELLPRLFQPERQSPLHEAEYRVLVDRYRKSGLEALATLDRQSLLAVAEAAFITHAKTMRYSVTSEASQTGDSDDAHGQAVLEEAYGDPDAPVVTARRIKGRAIEWRWAWLPRRDAEAPGQRLELLTYPHEEAESAVSTAWENRGGQWSCVRSEDRAQGFAWGELLHLRRFAEYTQGELLGRDTADGRPAYQLETKAYPSDVDLTYWLDADTLWLRQYEYEENGIRYTVKLEAVNEDITIEPPDVDVPCVEEQPE